MSAVAPAPNHEPNNSNNKYGAATSSSSSSNNNAVVVTLTAYIPTASVGAVIGRRGQNVEDLQRRAALAATTRQPVRVSVVGHDLKHQAVMSAVAPSSSSLSPAGTSGAPPSSAVVEGQHGGPSTSTTTSSSSPTTSSSLPYTYSALDFSNPAWTPVVIRADVPAAMAAGKGLSEACNGKLDEVVLDVPLTRHMHRSFIGAFGRTIAKLSADYTVRIMVPHKEAHLDLIQLEGELDNVQRCLIEILKIASRNTNNNKQQQAARGGDGDSCTDSLVVTTAPTHGKTRHIAKKTGVTIKKKKAVVAEDATAPAPAPAWELIVTGETTEQVESAMALLRKWRDQGNTTSGEGCANNTAQSPGRKGKAGGRNRQNSNNKGTPKRGKSNSNNNNAPRTPSAGSNETG